MCYASPGPRCEAHAKERFEKISEKSTKKFNELIELGKKKKAFEEEKPEAVGSPTHQRLVKKHNELRENTQALINKRKEARDEMDATSGGLETLHRKLAELPENDGNTKERHDLMQRIDKGQKTYSEKMLDYDKEHGTVNGRKPSNYGTMEGMKKLRDRAKKHRQAYLDANTTEEKNEAWEKYRTANNAFQHARETYKRDQMGMLNAQGSSPKVSVPETPEQKYTRAKSEFEQADAEYREATEKSRAILQKIIDLETEQTSQGRYMTVYSNNRRSYTKDAAEKHNRYIDEDKAQSEVVAEAIAKRKELRQKMKALEAERDIAQG